MNSIRAVRWIVFGLAWSGCLLAADAGKASPSAAKGKGEVWELPKTGKNIAREKGGWINVEATGRRLILKFFDPDKKPIAPDVLRGMAQFRYGGKSDSRAPLNVEGMHLATPATVHPPHNYLVLVSFFVDDSTKAAETLSFRYP